LAKEARFEGKGAPQSQTLIVLLYGYLLLDPETSLVPSGEKATELIDEPLWALVFSVTHLMSVAIILRTRERKRCLGCRRAFGSMEVWDHSTARLQVPKGADMQQPTACRKDESGMWLRSSSRTKSHMPLREAAQLGVSGLGSQVVVKRTSVEMVEAAASSPGLCCCCCCVESHVKSKLTGAA
jgi:hypothetical protein